MNHYFARKQFNLTPLLTALSLLFVLGLSWAHEDVVDTPVLKPEVSLPARRIVINIPSRNLWVYEEKKIIRYFPVGLGRKGFMTPVGHFTVLRKVLDPAWENPYQTKNPLRISPGENNPLGTRWIGFHKDKAGEYGIHGTDNPKSVGYFSSHGCVRMKVTDAEKLFEMVNVGTPVDVVYKTVLVRQKEDNVLVIVFSDRFNRGTPTPEKVKQDILEQYPGAKVDMMQLKKALQSPTEHAVNVGIIKPVVTEASSDITPDIPKSEPL